MPGLLDDLKKKAKEKLARERLTFSQVKTLGTYRRLVLYIEDISAKQPNQSDEVRGPSAEVAFDTSGKPTQAAIGFANSQKVPLEKLFVRTINNRNYVFAKVTRKGLPAEKVLTKLLPEIITSLYLPLAMRWGNLDFKFIRPIHSILALYGNKVIKFELAGIKSANLTLAHRYSRKPSPSGRGGLALRQRVRVSELLLYKKLLLKLGVIVDQEERQKLIRQKVETAAKKAGFKALITFDLLAEVVFLVENPIVYIGKFKPEFLEIPQEVLITSMKKNQKYFPLLDSQSKLLPNFAVVTDGCKLASVVEGNEKVLSARLSDARFFFEEDKKIPLKLRVADLTKVAFFEKLGTVAEKVERLIRLADWLGRPLGLDEQGLLITRRIVELCKADLTTKMVFEFPELQGVMGREYARLSGEDPRVALAIFEHYLPRFAEDKLPQSKPGLVVALADRLDLLVGAFSVGAIPTGSEDPYGLRRAAHGIIRIILENKLDLLLDEAIEKSYKTYEPIFLGNLFSKGEIGYQEFPRIKKEILFFFVSRLRSLLLDQGVRYDVSDAALYGFNDILDTVEKAIALNGLLKETWLPGVIASADRLTRIAGNAPREQVLEHDLAEQAEKELYALYLKINVSVNEKIKKESWAAAAKELAILTDPIEHFFDKVLVMHQDERIKVNRLALLKSLEQIYLSVADFRKIVIEGEKK